MFIFPYLDEKVIKVSEFYWFFGRFACLNWNVRCIFGA